MLAVWFHCFGQLSQSTNSVLFPSSFFKFNQQPTQVEKALLMDRSLVEVLSEVQRSQQKLKQGLALSKTALLKGNVIVVGLVVTFNRGGGGFIFCSHVFVKSVFMMHVGGTRCVPSSTDNSMKIRARITLTVEFIRGYIFLYVYVMFEYNDEYDQD